MIEGPGESAAEEPFVVRDLARSEVLHRHARLSKRGRPVFCSPSRAERGGAAVARQGRGTDGKVIYPTREAAEAAARELERLGSRTLRSYLCGRSRSGHFHLTTDGARLASRPLPERIPQQRWAPASAAPITPLQFADLHQRIPKQRRTAG
jgi:hypothetical protein